ncbi:MAG: DUF4242 domain-containing protein [Gammaproteobacteria bacterium]|nr:DUF4242 domain-containing protein [Gammaproteobacteria bacterium]
MSKFRGISDVGSFERGRFRETARKSNEVQAKLGAGIQWNHPFVADNETFCVYLAEDEGLIEEHAKRSGFPATRVTGVKRMIDPTTQSA